MIPVFLLFQFGLACKKPVQETAAVEAPIQVIETEPEAKAIALPQEVLQLSSNFQKVFFDLDQSILAEEGKSALSENAEIMQKHPDIRIEIQGHADERGTTEYNIALGQRRAKAVSDYFVAQGIAPSRLKIVSYGEEKPLTAEQNEMAYSKNRRCEFVIIWGGEAEVKGSDESE